MKKDNKSSIRYHDCSYITFNTVDWVDLFIRPACKQEIADSLNYFIETKGLVVFAWCLMTNHLHLVAKAKGSGGMAVFEKEFKRFTTTKILETIDEEPDLRRDWLLQRFEHSSQTLKRLEKFQLWQSCVNPVYIEFKQLYKLQERVLYIHENPVRDKIVARPEEYIFSSASDYAGNKGLVNVTVIDFAALRMSILKNGL